MAVGDLITGVSSSRGVQYEWASVLFGTGTHWIVESMDGLDSSPDMSTDDSQRNDDHGAIFGQDLLASRELTMDVDYDGSSHADVMAAYRTLARVMRPLTTTYPFAFQRPNEVKKQVWVRPRKRAFPSDGDVAMGLSNGTLVWDAPDPRIHSLVQNHVQIVLAAGVAAGSVVLTNAGDFHGWPKFTLSGAGSNPRIQVSAQTVDPLDGTNFNNRTIGIDVVMGAGDVLTVDARTKNIQLDGANAYNLKRTDNQWWEHMPGAQTVTFSRNVHTAAQTLDIYWYDTWL